MKWPWVSRAHLESRLREQDEAWMKLCDQQRESDNGFVLRAQEHARQAIDMLKERDADYRALLEKYHALRVSGANAVEASAPKLAPRTVKPADEAIETVMTHFNGNAQLRRRLQRFVHQERMKDGYDESAELRIAEQVQHWKDPDDEAAA